MANPAKKPNDHMHYLTTRWYLPGLYLIIMFYIGISLVMSTLSAHQLRHKVSQTQVGDRDMTMSLVKSIYNDIDKVKSDSSVQTQNSDARAKKLREQIQAIEKDVQAKRAELQKLEVTMYDTDAKILFVKEKLDIFNAPETALKSTGTTPTPTSLPTNTEWNTIEKISSQSAFDAMYWALRAEFSKSEPQRLVLKREVEFYTNQLEKAEDNLESERENFSSLLAKSDSQINNILKAHNVGEMQDGKTVYKSDQLTELLDDYKFWGSNRPKSVFGKMLQPLKAINFAEFPAELLTILVVSFMGVLGSLVSLTREFMLPKNNKLKVSDYIFRPILGAVTAFVVFVLAKAGFLIITTPPSSGEGAAMSPFFISFLGLISGLLAEDALRQILNFGRNLFVGGLAGPERWAIHLKQIIADKKVDRNDMAASLRVSLTRLEEWIEEKKEVPVKFQDRISTYLHKTPREIFTDLPPYQEDEDEA